jgi:EAL domain-containing protein (putative c-di-GMP-specific phosphodiesterase class I)
LPAAALRGDADWSKADGVLGLARAHLGMEVALLTEFTDGGAVVRAAIGDLAALNLAVGSRGPFDDTYCGRVLAGTHAEVVPDAHRDPGTGDLAIARDRGVGSYVAVPVLGPDGRPRAMLCCVSRAAYPGLDGQAARFLGLCADAIAGDVLDGEPTAPRVASRAVRALHEVLDMRAVQMVFQPVLRLDDGGTAGFEALARFLPEHFGSPVEAFAAAAAVGLGPDLELLAVQNAFARLPEIPDRCVMGVNLSVEALMVPAVQDTLLAHAHRDIGVEITEHTQVPDYTGLLVVTDRLRAAGIMIIVDDAGAGFASLSHILQLRPDVIKLDITLVRDIDADPVRQALARSLVTFSHDIGALLVAEGIETCAEHRKLRDLGVGFGQGYFMARPAPLPQPDTYIVSPARPDRLAG